MLKTGNNKYEIVGTDGQTPIYEPRSKTWIDLKTLSDRQCGELVVYNFPYLKRLPKEEGEISQAKPAKPKKSEVKKSGN